MLLDHPENGGPGLAPQSALITNQTSLASDTAHKNDKKLARILKECPPINEYEAELRKLEADARQQMKVEQQLRLHIEVTEELNLQKVRDLEQ